MVIAVDFAKLLWFDYLYVKYATARRENVCRDNVLNARYGQEASYRDEINLGISGVL